MAGNLETFLARQQQRGRPVPVFVERSMRAFLECGVLAGSDRTRLERLCRHTARPPLAIDRLELLSDGRLRYRFKRVWRNGTTHAVFEPLQLLERLSVLVPVPRANLIRYHGVMAPAAKWRPLVVPGGPASGDNGSTAGVDASGE